MAEKGLPLVSIVIVSWNTRDLLERALRSLPKTDLRFAIEILVIDNGSSDGSPEMVREQFPDARLVENKGNVGFASANNQGAELADGTYLLLLNSDAELKPGALQAMVRKLEDNPEAGLAGGKILNHDGSMQASWMDFPGIWREFLILSGLGRLVFGPWYPSHGPEDSARPRKVDYVSGACMLVRRGAFTDVGGFDPGFFMYAEEVDLCYRMRGANWQVWYMPDAEVIHLGGGSSKSLAAKREADLYQSRVRYFRKHLGILPAYTLAGMIIILTTAKYYLHALLRWMSAGNRGREVVAPGRLFLQLRRVL